MWNTTVAGKKVSPEKQEGSLGLVVSYTNSDTMTSYKTPARVPLGGQVEFNVVFMEIVTSTEPVLPLTSFLSGLVSKVDET